MSDIEAPFELAISYEEAAHKLQAKIDRMRNEKLKNKYAVNFRTLSKNGRDQLIQKISQDILFLEDRINHLLDLRVKNAILLKNYEKMLENRKMVLRWCKSNYPLGLPEENEPQHHSA